MEGVLEYGRYYGGPGRPDGGRLAQAGGPTGRRIPVDLIVATPQTAPRCPVSGDPRRGPEGPDGA
jgi:hypothetical protein